MKSADKKRKKEHQKEEEEEKEESGLYTKDDILQQLALFGGGGGLVGKYGTGSKAGMTKDLIDGLEKDLEKLKRQSDNLQVRKVVAIKGEAPEEPTEEEKEIRLKERMKRELEEEYAKVLHADEKRIQAMRHQASQLGNTKRMDLHQLDEERKENEERIQELEAILYGDDEKLRERLMRKEMRRIKQESLSSKSEDEGGIDEGRKGRTPKSQRSTRKSRSKSNKRNKSDKKVRISMKQGERSDSR